MSEQANTPVPLPSGGEVTQFDPKQTKAKLRQLDAVITEVTEAQRELPEDIRNWELLDEAATAKIDEQKTFVLWWTKQISSRESPGRGGVKSGPDHGQILGQRPGEEHGISHQMVARWRKSLEDVTTYHTEIMQAARKAAGLIDNHLALGEGNDEWCTPQAWVDLARGVMGGIALDPATNEGAQTRIQADRYFTAADNALDQSWEAASVWLNPPYSKDKIAPFVQKLIDEINNGHIREAIVLVNAATSSDWFHRLGDYADMVAFVRERIKFLNPDGSTADGSPPIGQTFFYFGKRPDVFGNAFAAKRNDGKRLSMLLYNAVEKPDA